MPTYRDTPFQPGTRSTSECSCTMLRRFNMLRADETDPGCPFHGTTSAAVEIAVGDEKEVIEGVTVGRLEGVDVAELEKDTAPPIPSAVTTTTASPDPQDDEGAGFDVDDFGVLGRH